MIQSRHGLSRSRQPDRRPHHKAGHKYLRTVDDERQAVWAAVRMPGRHRTATRTLGEPAQLPHGRDRDAAAGDVLPPAPSAGDVASRRVALDAMLEYYNRRYRVSI